MYRTLILLILISYNARADIFSEISNLHSRGNAPELSEFEAESVWAGSCAVAAFPNLELAALLHVYLPIVGPAEDLRLIEVVDAQPGNVEKYQQLNSQEACVLHEAVESEIPKASPIFYSSDPKINELNWTFTYSQLTEWQGVRSSFPQSTKPIFTVRTRCGNQRGCYLHKKKYNLGATIRFCEYWTKIL